MKLPNIMPPMEGASAAAMRAPNRPKSGWSTRFCANCLATALSAA